MKAVLQDIYRAIDQDDDDFEMDIQENLRKNSENSDIIDLIHMEGYLNKCGNMYPISTIIANEATISPEKKNCLNQELVRKTLSSELVSPTDRLIEAIESLRYSIQDNSQSHDRNIGKGRVRRHPSTYGNKKRETHGTPAEENLKVRKDKVAVELRIVFLKIGEIDTLKELYHADAFIQAKWREPRLDGQPSDKLSSIDPDKYWSPSLYIDNILSETKDAQWLTAVTNEQNEATIIERRRIKGVFLETLELNDFPLDVQDLTITVTTERPDSEIDLIPDQTEMSAINVQTFVDQQEWMLHEHVEITKRIILQEYSSSMKSHPCLSVTCRAARRPGYFYWNVFLIMFMISGLSFATFAVSPEKAEYRLRLSFTLVLTSVTFKYVITQSLPKISYLTYMDKYVLMSLAILCIVSIWHSCVTMFLQGSTISMLTKINKNTSYKNFNLNQSFQNKEFIERLEEESLFLRTILRNIKQSEGEYIDDFEEEPVNMETDDGEKKLMPNEIAFLKTIERDVFISFGAIYIVAHLIFIFWLYFDASKRRRIMLQKDKDYRAFLHKNRQWQLNQQKRRDESHARLSNVSMHVMF